MIALIAAAATGPADLDTLTRAVAECDRTAVSRSWSAEVERHSGFLISAVREQRAISDERAAIAERRRKLRLGTGSVGDTEAGLAIAAADLDERQRVLDDAARADRLESETVGYLRQLYITQCNGRAS